MKYKKIATLLLFAPVPTLAFSLGQSSFPGVISEVINMLRVLFPILITLAFLFFFWGLSKFILNAGSQEGVKKGRDYMMWGILALFILLTFRVIVGLIASDLEIGDTNALPLLPTSNNSNSTGIST